MCVVVLALNSSTTRWRCRVRTSFLQSLRASSHGVDRSGQLDGEYDDRYVHVPYRPFFVRGLLISLAIQSRSEICIFHPQASLEEVEGYVRSWSAYNAYMKRNAKEGGDGDDPAKELFSEKLPELFNDTRAKAALSNKNSLSTTFVTTRTPAFMRLCS